MVVCTVVAACSGGEVNRFDLNAFSLDAEWQLGREMAAEIEQQVTVVDDPVVDAFVDGIGEELVAQTELADREWSFTVIRDPSINAFAIPGGHVYVHSGLLLAAPSDELVAGVLAHEVAHVEARHGTERLTQTLGIQAALALVGSDGGIEAVVGDLLGQSLQAKFSRDDEREADRLGVGHLAASGRSPDGLPEFFELLRTEAQRSPSSVEQFFSTHPRAEERLETTRELAADVERARPFVESDPEAFAEVRRRLGAGGG